MTESGKWIFKGANEMDKKLVGGITDMIERACNMSEIDKIYRHLECLLYEEAGMVDDFPENYGGTDD
jgi:hypothetical protein